MSLNFHPNSIYHETEPVYNTLYRRFANGQIDIRLGLEVEYYPRFFGRLLEITGQYPIEYFLLGQHFTDNETDGQYSGIPTRDEAVLARYCEQTLEGLGTGRFLYFAHPDLLHFVGDPKVYDRHIRALCRGVKALGVPLEINFLGLYEGRHYPTPDFWRIAGEEGCEAVLGCDAHDPEAMDRPDVEQRGRALAAQCGLRIRETMAL